MQRPFLADVAAGVIVAVAAAEGYIAAATRDSWSQAESGQLAALLFQSFVWVGPAALLGALLGVWFAREMGWRHPRATGLIVAVVLGVAAAILVRRGL